MTTTQKYTDIIEQATLAQAAEAGAWYANANSFARELSVSSGLSVEVTASVIAAFSPRCPWSRNLFLASEFLAGNPVGALGASIRNAEYAVVAGFDALKGRKTNAFARNIAGDLSVVTIDTWMIKAAGLDSSKSLNKTTYTELSDSTKIAAEVYDLKPAVAQALIWIIVRGSAD